MTNSTSSGSRTDGFTPSSGSKTSKLPSGKVAAITTGALLLGGTALALMSDGRPGNNNDPKNPNEEQNSVDTADKTQSLQVMPTANVDATFDEAFDTARDQMGPGALFVWQGKAYHTFTQDEWKDLSLNQRQEFISSVKGPDQQGNTNLQPITNTASQTELIEPQYIEGEVNGQRVMGIDLDRDGVVDELVMQGPNGYTYRVLDAEGNDGLDTVYVFDPITQDNVMMLKLPDPVMLSTDSLDEAIHSPDLVQSVQYAMDIEEENSSLTEAPSDELMESLEDDNTGETEEEELTIPQEEENVTEDDEELEELTVEDDEQDEVSAYNEEADNTQYNSDYGHQPTH